MNVFKRIGDIISSNVNAALDKMEDPEKMIDLSIKELEDSILQMKAIYAEKSAEAKNLERALGENISASERWADRAKLALSKNEENMAKEAIEEKLKASNKASLIKDSLSELNAILANLEDSRKEAEEKLQDMKLKSVSLKAKAKSAKEKKRVADITSSPENARFERRLAEISAKIDKWEAYSSDPCAVRENTRKTYEDLEREDAIEKEMARIKAEINC